MKNVDYYHGSTKKNIEKRKKNQKPKT